VPELLYADDLNVGTTIELGIYDVSRREILDFARHWDPQPIHLDDEVAARGYFGEVIASGMHTVSIYQRLAVLGAYRHWAVLAGRTIHELRLLKPVTAGMVLSGRLEVTGVTLSRPDRGLVATRGVLSAAGEPVMTSFQDAFLFRRQEPI
jgi:acyl dehydratase